FGQTQFFEGNAGEIQGLRAAVVGFSINALLIVATGMILDALFGFGEQNRARTVNYSASGAHAGASGLEAFLQTIAAQLAFRDARVVSLPLETRDVIGTGDGAVPAADAFVGGPAHDAGLRIFVESLEGTARSASGIQALHALALHKRIGRSIFWLVKLDDVAGEFVEIGGRLMQLVAANILGSVVGLGAGCLTGFTTDADAGVVKQSDSGAGNRNLFRLKGFRADGKGYGRRHSGLGDGGKQFSPSDGHISPLSSEFGSRTTA